MSYTEIQKRNGKDYHYRVKSVRNGNKISKERVYLGVNLNERQLVKAESEADKQLGVFKTLLSKEEIKFLESIKKEYLRQPKESFENRYESFCARFTYDSNAIEGNTLTLQETAQILFENIVPAAKSLREINEAVNHKKAFDYILSYDGELNKSFILHLHKLVVKDTLKRELAEQIGKYRNIQVYIRGTKWLPPKSSDVPKEMKSLLSWYSKNKTAIHPVTLAAYFHVGFETIHPFVDGNGRVGRLLMNFILRKNKFPMINIPTTNKLDYYKSLEEAQLNGNLKSFLEFLLEIYREDKLYI